MNRLEFMNQLEQLLSDIPEAEKREALQYYEDYFNDAGVESEQEVINSLDSPENIARAIKSEIGVGQKAFDSNKIDCWENERTRAEQPYQNTASYAERTQSQPVKTEEKSKLSGGMIALIVILCIFASPLILSLAITVLSLLFAVYITIFSLIVAFGAISISFFIAAILMVIVGIIKLAAAPAGGLVLIGSGLLMGGLALLSLLLTIWLTVTVIPALSKGVFFLCKAPFRKKA